MTTRIITGFNQRFPIASLSVLLLTFSGSSIAEWIEYSTKSNGDVFFYDNTRVDKANSQIKVWTRIRYKTSVMAASSYQNLLKIDCHEHSEKILQSTFYTDKEWTTPAMSTNTNAKPKIVVKPNSTTGQLINILCSDS